MANIEPFHTLSVEKETAYNGTPGSGKATIRFYVGGKSINFKKNTGYTADVEDVEDAETGTTQTLKVSVTVGDMKYRSDLKKLKIMKVNKETDVKIDKHHMDVTVTKTSEFRAEDEIQK